MRTTSTRTTNRQRQAMLLVLTGLLVFVVLPPLLPSAFPLRQLGQDRQDIHDGPPTTIVEKTAHAATNENSSGRHHSTTALNLTRNVTTIQAIITDRRNITSPCFATTLAEIQQCLQTQARDGHPVVAFVCPRQENYHRLYQHTNSDNVSTVFPCDPRQAMLAVPTAMVVNKRGSVLDVESGTVYDVAGGLALQRKKDHTIKIGRTIPLPLASHHRPLLSLSQRHDNTYYHFVVDVLGKLLFDNDLLLSWIQEGWLDFFVSGQAALHEKYLKLLLCQKGQPTSSSGTPCWSPSQRHFKTDIVDKKAVFPIIFMPPDRVDTHKSIVQQGLHTALQAACTPSTTNQESQKKFVVLKRKNRRVLNLADMVQILEELYADVDFVWVDDDMLNAMSVCETFAMFGKAEGIIGGHGAGLTNMLFLDSNATTAGEGPVVIQFVHRDQRGAECYQELTQHLNIRHYEMMTVTHLAEPPENGRRIGQYENTIIDICRAEEMVRPVFEDLSTRRKHSPLLSKLCSGNHTGTAR